MQQIGTCHCGAVAFTVSGDPLQVLNCHCQQCRNMNGSAFSSYVVVPTARVDITRGASAIAVYAVNERVARHFCSQCGTALFNTNPVTYPGLSILYLGTLANAADLKPRLNIFCDSKLPWVDEIAAMKALGGAPG